ncbi:serine hydrolase domain-containing protein [Actinophytocola oryzae]|uniref:D-alanyl-D-alanine carboxypeptidase n=1 Tax=Actinophytocola oryzae TaxID=502181 RepID=A0A4R7VR01_9PSEU|nr:serine hydrolase domain-containing protein [Actinophytocola oryzae]TDV52193.1 D-alanyl-D-alanine carboxypeptidase [Actinophytocola oryzae]
MRILVGVMSAAVLATGVGAPAVGDVLDDTVESMVAAGAPGAVGYTRTGDERRHAAAGYADVARRERADVRQRFRIASNTKAFTAAVVLQLVGEKRLALDAPVSRWLPEVPGDITVRGLLNHTSGLWDPTTEKEFWASYLAGDRGYVYRPADLVARALAHARVPGYSNTNYLVAGQLIEKMTGRSAVSEVYRRILVPLRLADTSFPTVDPQLHGRHLHGYALDGRTDMTVFSPSYDWTAGAMVSTLDDLARFYRALFDGTLLRPAELAQLRTTVDVKGVAMGLGIDRLEVPCADGADRVLWANSGGGPGFGSYAFISGDASRQLVVAMNVYDIEEELSGRSPVPEGVSVARALREVFC